MLSKLSVPLIVLFIFGFCSICFAKFTVVLTNGTSQEVSKIYFNGATADLYLLSGNKLRVAVDTIDFAKSGFKKPEAQITTLYGTGTSNTGSEGLSQSELEALWNASHQTVVANNDLGSITKGEVVRVIESSPIRTVILTKDRDGRYKRIVMDSGTYADTFEASEPAQPAPKSHQQNPQEPAPAPEEDGSYLSLEGPPGTASKAELPEHQSPLSELLLPAGVAAALGILLLILSFTTSGSARWIFVVAFFALLALGGKYGYQEWVEYSILDEAQGRVKTFFYNISRLSDEQSVQVAVAVWSRGTLTIRNPTEFAAAKYECFRWMEKGRIGVVKNYQLMGAELRKGSSAPETVVFVTVDDNLRKILVTPGQPLSWAGTEEREE